MNNFIKIAKSSYTSIGVLNFDHLKNILNYWNKFIPYVQPYYAIKSFPNDKLLRFLSNYDIGYDVASRDEISMVKKFNRPIIYANPVKSIDDIKYAKKNNVVNLVVDSVEECDKIKQIYPKSNIIIRVISDELFSQIKFNKKFGANSNDIINIIDYLKYYNMNFSGYSFHVGSKCSNNIAYHNTITDILNLHYSIYNIPPKIIDIGGGFENMEQIIELSNYLHPIDKKIKLIAEPGRLFSNSILDLYTKVIGVRKRVIDNMETNYISINDSIYHTLNGKIFDGQYFEPIPLYENDIRERCIIFGNTCDSLDMIVDNILPVPKLNDIIMFKNVGAYSLASANGKFNGFSACNII